MKGEYLSTAEQDRGLGGKGHGKVEYTHYLVILDKSYLSNPRFLTQVEKSGAKKTFPQVMEHLRKVDRHKYMGSQIWLCE